MRKLTYALLAAALAVTVLAGCSRKAEAEGSTQQATSAAQEKPVKADKEKETKAEEERRIRQAPKPRRSPGLRLKPSPRSWQPAATT